MISINNCFVIQEWQFFIMRFLIAIVIRYKWALIITWKVVVLIFRCFYLTTSLRNSHLTTFNLLIFKEMVNINSFLGSIGLFMGLIKIFKKENEFYHCNTSSTKLDDDMKVLSVFQPVPHALGYQRSILEYLLCKMNFIIRFIWQFKRAVSFWMSKF